MSYKPYYAKGDWNTICDVCGRMFKASQLKQRWDGLMTCGVDWEPRQPQDFVRAVADIQAPPFSRPESTDIFITINTFTLNPIDDTTLSDFVASERLVPQGVVNGTVINALPLG